MISDDKLERVLIRIRHLALRCQGETYDYSIGQATGVPICGGLGPMTLDESSCNGFGPSLEPEPSESDAE